MSARNDKLYDDLSKEILKYTQNQGDSLPPQIKSILDEIKEQNNKYGIVWSITNSKEQFEKDIENGFVPYLKERPELSVAKSDKKECNILIEGDNYHALTLLQATHKEKIDVIYIDPPYNTGNKDFKYNDRYVDIEDGYRHSKWLSFMHKRLSLAKNLLSEDGAIFISIDDNEFAQLKLLCDEIFGDDNFICNCVWKKKGGASNTETRIGVITEYIFVYAKNASKIKFNKRKIEKSGKFLVDENEPNRYYILETLLKTDQGIYKRDTMKFGITLGEHTIFPPEGKRWIIGEKTSHELIAQNLLVLSSTKTGSFEIKKKSYIEDYLTDGTYLNMFEDKGSLQSAKEEIKKLGFDREIFDTPKPTRLIGHILDIFSSKDSICLDFFAGSGSTGQAVLEANELDGGTRQFILCTNNENNICEEVTHKRIEKVITGSSEYKGIAANLKYYQIDFIEKNANMLSFQTQFMSKINELVLIKENFHNYSSVNFFEHYCVYERGEQKLIIVTDADEFFDILRKTLYNTNDPNFSLLNSNNKYFIFNHFKNNSYDLEADTALVNQFKTILPTQEIRIIPKEIINTILGANK